MCDILARPRVRGVRYGRIGVTFYLTRYFCAQNYLGVNNFYNLMQFKIGSYNTHYRILFLIKRLVSIGRTTPRGWGYPERPGGVGAGLPIMRARNSKSPHPKVIPPHHSSSPLIPTVSKFLPFQINLLGVYHGIPRLSEILASFPGCGILMATG